MKKKTIEKLRSYAIVGDKERASEIISELEKLGMFKGMDFNLFDNKEYSVGSLMQLFSQPKGSTNPEWVLTLDEYLKIKTDLIAKEGNSKKKLKVLVKEQASHIEELKGKESEYLQVIEKQTYHINELLAKNKEEKAVEPKRGEVWVSEEEGESEYKVIYRYRAITHHKIRPELMNGYYFSLANKRGFWLNNWLICWDNKRVMRLATAEEEQELIKKEHENGKHWNGEDLVDIPEYVDARHWGIVKLDFSTYDMANDNFHTIKSSERITIRYALKNPSSKEAYDKQNEPKPLFENNYGKFFEGDNCFFVNKEKLKVHTCMIHKYLVAVEQENTSMVMKTKKQAYQWIKDNIEKLR